MNNAPTAYKLDTLESRLCQRDIPIERWKDVTMSFLSEHLSSADAFELARIEEVVKDYPPFELDVFSDGWLKFYRTDQCSLPFFAIEIKQRGVPDELFPLL